MLYHMVYYRWIEQYLQQDHHHSDRLLCHSYTAYYIPHDDDRDRQQDQPRPILFPAAIMAIGVVKSHSRRNGLILILLHISKKAATAKLQYTATIAIYCTVLRIAAVSSTSPLVVQTIETRPITMVAHLRVHLPQYPLQDRYCCLLRWYMDKWE